MNTYDVEYRFQSQKVNNSERHWIVHANNYGDAESVFDDMFGLANNILDDVYGDDCSYEIISISVKN